jgi:predicted ester cyclase
MPKEDLKALQRHFYEEANKGREALLAVSRDMADPNVVIHGGSGRDMGPNDYVQWVNALYGALPDVHITLDDIIVEGDKVVVRYTVTGTHKGTYMGIIPTNKKVSFWAIEIDRMVNGKFVECWARYDTLGLMQQLGLQLVPGKGK